MVICGSLALKREDIPGRRLPSQIRDEETYAQAWEHCEIGDLTERVVRPVEVIRTALYKEIGIRSHGKGIFEKPPVTGLHLGSKRVFWVEPNCLILNIVFAWEQAVARTTCDHIGRIVSHRFPMFRAKHGKLDIDFLLYFLKSGMGKILLGSISPGGAGRNKTLNQSDFERVHLCLPPLNEQTRIADLLQTWDGAITQTINLIAAKRRRKRAFLQKLFESFPRIPLLETAEIWFSGVDKKLKLTEKSVKICNYVDVLNNLRISDDIKFMSGTASEAEISNNSLCRHDVVFTKDSETAEEIAEPALIADDIENLVCGYHLAIARPLQGTYGPFLAQAMRHPEIRRQFSRLANGVVRFGLTLEALAEAQIFLPSIKIQRRVGMALDAEDRTIEGLVHRVHLLSIQRRCLIQKLLTGEWRLPAIPRVGAA